MLDKLQDQLKTSLKAKDELRTSVLRMLISDFRYAQIEKRGPLDDNESMQVIQKAIKKRKESIDMFEKGGRQELADKEKAELKILQEFAPGQMDDAATAQKVDAVIAEL